jgi:hypothetical protein
VHPEPAVLARPRAQVALVGLVVLAVGLGLFDNISDTEIVSSRLGSWLAPAAELGGPWAALAFAGGYVMRRRITAVVTGVGLLTVAMVAFMTFATSRYDATTKVDYLTHEGGFWLLAVTGFGAAFGLCGWAATQPHARWRATGFALLSAFLLAEVLVNSWRWLGHRPLLLGGVEMLAAADVAKAGIRRTSARLVLPILAVAVGCIMLVAVAAFQIFPLLGPATAGP